MEERRNSNSQSGKLPNNNKKKACQVWLLKSASDRHFGRWSTVTGTSSSIMRIQLDDLKKQLVVSGIQQWLKTLGWNVGTSPQIYRFKESTPMKSELFVDLQSQLWVHTWPDFALFKKAPEIPSNIAQMFHFNLKIYFYSSQFKCIDVFGFDSRLKNNQEDRSVPKNTMRWITGSWFWY